MDINLLLRKADELKALFILGQRVIPFLEEIFLFVNEIKPLLDDINSSIEENLRKMPSASKQLSKVTEATELATTEILDIVDGIVYKSDIISSNLKHLTGINNDSKKSPIKILELIAQTTQDIDEFKDLQPHLKNAINSLKSSQDVDFTKIVGDTEKILTSIKDDSTSIMFSLQVQDITSQQIAAVNHLLETIQGKLENILTKFQNTEISDLVNTSKEQSERANVTKLHRDIAFDPDAVDSLAMKDTRQDDVDMMMKEHLESPKAVEDNSPTSQDDIDAMFSGNNVQSLQEIKQTVEVERPKEQKVSSPAPVAEIEDGLEPFSQDDIDALFHNV